MASQGKSRGSDHPQPSGSRTPAHVPGGTAQLQDSPAQPPCGACRQGSGPARRVGVPLGEPNSSLPKVRVTPYSPFKVTRSPGSALLYPASPKRRPHVLTPLEASDTATLQTGSVCSWTTPGADSLWDPGRESALLGPCLLRVGG